MTIYSPLTLRVAKSPIGANTTSTGMAAKSPIVARSLKTFQLVYKIDNRVPHLFRLHFNMLPKYIQRKRTSFYLQKPHDCVKKVAQTRPIPPNQEIYYVNIS